MGFGGSLDSVSFADLLNTLCKVNKEGTLVVSNENRKKMIHFGDNGVNLVGGVKRLELGEILVREKKIQEWEFKSALEEKDRTGQNLEFIFVSQGWVTQEDIEQVICNHIEEEICDIFFWENASFNFTEGSFEEETLEGEDGPVNFTFDVQSLLFRMAQNAEEWEEIRQNIPSLNTVLVAVSDDIEPDVELIESFGVIIQLLDGTNDINDVIASTKLSILEACRTLSMIVERGLAQSATYDQLLSQAQSCRDLGQIQKQIQLLKLALKSDLPSPDNEILLQIAQAYEAIGNRDEAVKNYCSVGDATARDEPKQAIKLYEIAIEMDSEATLPRERIIDVAIQVNDEAKEIFHGRKLAHLYHSKGKLTESLDLSRNFLRRRPEDIDFREIVVKIYLDRGETDKVIYEYEEMASLLDKNIQSPAYRKVLENILNLAPERADIQKLLRDVNKTLFWQKHRKNILSVFGVVLGIILWFAYSWYYEAQASSLYQFAEKCFELQQFDKAREYSDQIITSYPGSLVKEKAESIITQIDAYQQELLQQKRARQEELENRLKQNSQRVEERIMAGFLDEAEMDLENYAREYLDQKWDKLRPKIAASDSEMRVLIQKKRIEKSEEEALSQYKEAEDLGKAGKWEEAQKKFRSLRNHPTLGSKAREFETKLTQEIYIDLRRKIKKSITQASSLHNERKYTSALEEYRETLIFVERIQKIGISKQLEKLDIEHQSKLAARGVSEIEKLFGVVKKLMQESELLLAESQSLQVKKQEEESDAKTREAFQKMLQIATDPDMSVTPFATNALLPIKVVTLPAGAKIKGTNLVTPCHYGIKSEDSVELTITHEGFDEEKIQLKKDMDPVKRISLKKTKLWDYALSSGVFWAEPNVVKSDLILTSRSGKVLALNIKQRKLWEFSTTKGLGDIIGEITPYENGLYFGSNDNYAYGIYSQTGKEIWRYKAESFIQVKPAVDEEKVYFGTISGTFYCLDRKTGERIWGYRLSDSIKTNPLFLGRLIVFGTKNGYLVGLDAISGKRRWATKLQGGVLTKMTLSGNDLFVCTDLGYIYCIDAESKKNRWRKKLEGKCEGHVVTLGNKVYLVTVNGYAYCLQRNDGSNVAQKNFQSDSEIYSSPAYSRNNDKIYFGDMNGWVYALDVYDLEITWKQKLSEKGIHADLVIEKGILYVASEEGIIYAFKE